MLYSITLLMADPQFFTFKVRSMKRSMITFFTTEHVHAEFHPAN